MVEILSPREECRDPARCAGGLSVQLVSQPFEEPSRQLGGNGRHVPRLIIS